MPRIPERFLNCAVYLYPSEVEARAGVRSGGSGFICSIPSAIDKNHAHIYVVTNSHVIEAGSTIIRINTREGTTDILSTEKSSWFHHPAGDDLAVCSVNLPLEKYNYSYISRIMFLDKGIIDQYNIGPGDDVFLVGRFVNHEGKQRNLPSVRFGNIAMMPWEPIKQDRLGGFLQESFMVELRSIGGTSGSPVFIYFSPLRPIMTTRPAKDRRAGFLLGILWGHILTEERIRDSDGEKMREGWKVRANSGMAGVVPAWKLDELLNIGELVELREEDEKRLAEELKKEEAGTTLNSEAFSREDFEDVSKKISRPEEARSDEETTET